ncbi:MAG: single-strand DNA-binding protein [Verrucomicrobia bacterium]|jgi:single-strand DNA-binding protein|nr:MAG: single-strand DNA-binding protein [Verrucomicrobiota bacterium]
MANLNKVMVIGNLTRDPEIKYTPKGSAIADIALAINRNYTTDSGEKREETTYVDIVLYGRLAEIAGEYLKKGRPVYIEGRLKLDTWDDKQTGQKRSKMRVVGEGLQLLGSRDGVREGSSSGGGGEYDEADRAVGARRPQPRPESGRPATSRPPADPDLDVEHDDIPF